MKHIKLFEEFKVEYNLIKDFPPKGCCVCKDEDEAQALIDMLELAKYKNANQSYEAKGPTIVWKESLQYYRTNVPAWKFSDYTKIEFDDYFEVKEKYKGHQTGKKYGI
jgi:hypothetical protein